ncbi:raftlin-like [Arapaima gigas]
MFHLEEILTVPPGSSRRRQKTETLGRSARPRSAAPPQRRLLRFFAFEASASEKTRRTTCPEAPQKISRGQCPLPPTHTRVGCLFNITSVGRPEKKKEKKTRKLHGDLPPKTVESVFIFQEGPEGESGAATAYDAIVVEQWTVIDGVAVKTDYIPLLQSLAMYGWRLTCVLPTPVVKTNSDGSLATKQIVFLQRPVLPRKKKESKILSFRTRNKSNKNSVKDAPKEKTKKSESPGSEKETDEQRSGRGEENEEVVRKNIENRPGERTSLETKGDQGPEAEREAGEADGEEAGGGGPGDRPEAAGGSKAAAGGEQAERPEEKDELAEMDDGQQSAGGEEGRGPAGCEESAVLRVSAETERIPEAADPSSDSAPLGSEQ